MRVSMNKGREDGNNFMSVMAGINLEHKNP